SRSVSPVRSDRSAVTRRLGPRAKWVAIWFNGGPSDQETGGSQGFAATAARGTLFAAPSETPRLRRPHPGPPPSAVTFRGRRMRYEESSFRSGRRPGGAARRLREQPAV